MHRGLETKKMNKFNIYETMNLYDVPIITIQNADFYVKVQ